MSALSALPPPMTTIRNETFFRVNGGWRCWQAAKGWLCLTDAQRYYTTLQFWQVTGSAGGVHPKMGASFWLPLGSYTGTFSPLLWTTPNLGCTPAGVYPRLLARFSPYFVSYAGCGRDARDPRGICNNLGCTRRRVGHCGVGGWLCGIVPLFALLRRRLFGSLGRRRMRRPERVQVAVQRTDVDHTLRHRGRKVDGIARLVASEFLPPFRNERVVGIHHVSRRIRRRPSRPVRQLSNRLW